MKKYFLAIMITGVSVVSNAQQKAETGYVVNDKKNANSSKFSLGPTAGVGWATISNIDNSKFNIAYNAGLSLVYSATEHFGIGLDMKYSAEGAKAKQTIGGTEYEMKQELKYFRLPLKAIYFFNSYGDKVRPKIFAGPSFGFLLSAEESASNTSIDNKEDFKSFDFGITAGGGVNLRLANKTWLNLDVSYLQGLQNLGKNSSESNKNMNLMLNAGLNFGL